MRWQFGLASDIGGRAEQQDRVAVFEVPNRADSHLVVLADGMGGHSDGDLAAQAVLDTAERALADTDTAYPREFLESVCVRANRAVLAVGRHHRSNAGSTCVLLYLAADEAYWAHVGDSRLYHFADAELLSHTRDHTVGELLKDATHTHSAEPRSAQLLYSCLGGHNSLQPDFGASATGSGDWFLLCSDGFWNQVDADEAAATLLAAGRGEGVADRLVRLAIERGGSRGDNVSVVLAIRRSTPLARAWRRIVGGTR